MKLPKYTSISITSASLIIYGFGVAVTPTFAQELISDDVSAQIESVLGEADNDELLVDRLSQVESELRELGVSSFGLQDRDGEEVVDLKLQRRDYIRTLRDRLNDQVGEDRSQFLSKIRNRRTQVRSQLRQIRSERVENRRQTVQDSARDLREETGEAREKFRENLDRLKDEARENAKDARVKFQERLQKRQTERSNVSVEVRRKQIRERNLERQKVQGAVDYQPQGVLERIGYWISSL